MICCFDLLSNALGDKNCKESAKLKVPFLSLNLTLNAYAGAASAEKFAPKKHTVSNNRNFFM